MVGGEMSCSDNVEHHISSSLLWTIDSSLYVDVSRPEPNEEDLTLDDVQILLSPQTTDDTDYELADQSPCLQGICCIHYGFISAR